MINEKSIPQMTREELFSAETFLDLFDLSEEERKRLEVILTLRAADLGVEKQFVSVMKSYSTADQKLTKEYRKTLHKYSGLELDRNGKPAASTDNYIKIFEKDKKFRGLKFNMLSESPEQETDGVTRRWTDADDAGARWYIEKEYGIYSVKKCDDALRVIFTRNEYHPIRQIVDAIEWDGKSRISSFLTKWMKCEDTPYTQEVSRLIFAGGIHRLYDPGCKFDDMAVLVGTKQGEGKSTLVRWLALNDSYFTEVNEFEGQSAMQSLEGAWICEVSELLAMTKTKDVEAVKSFLTRLNDRRRKPYDRRTTDHPRQCIFIGTTNKEQFLTDKTGNRRFYPVVCKQNGYDLFNHEAVVKEDIRQCWAEAKHLYDEGKMLPYADWKLDPIYKEKQAKALEDDYRVGMIESYLEDKSEVCILELWREALQNSIYSKPTKKDSNEIALILQSFPDWEKADLPKRFVDYGLQKYWKKAISDTETLLDDDIFP